MITPMTLVVMTMAVSIGDATFYLHSAREQKMFRPPGFCRKVLGLPKDFVKTWRYIKGGYGSERPSCKQKAEECRALDVNRLSREGCLCPDSQGSWVWSRDDEEIGRIGYRAFEVGRLIGWRYLAKNTKLLAEYQKRLWRSFHNSCLDPILQAARECGRKLNRDNNLKRFLQVTALGMALAIGAQGANAQDFDAGVAAYSNGDYETALAEFRPLAEQGNARAQFILGLMYYKGEGVPQDRAEAVKWTRLAAEQGYAQAQQKLGLMYSNGDGVPQDKAEALKWTHLAAEQGSAGAQAKLGWMYSNGDGVSQDKAEAVKWYRLAAEQGSAWAQNTLGVMYSNGEGVIQDYLRAHMWFNIAAASGDEDGASNRELAATKMTPEAIAQAQQMARECVAKDYKGC